MLIVVIRIFREKGLLLGFLHFSLHLKLLQHCLESFVVFFVSIVRASLDQNNSVNFRVVVRTLNKLYLKMIFAVVGPFDLLAFIIELFVFNFKFMEGVVWKEFAARQSNDVKLGDDFGVSKLHVEDLHVRFVEILLAKLENKGEDSVLSEAERDFIVEVFICPTLRMIHL